MNEILELVGMKKEWLSESFTKNGKAKTTVLPAVLAQHIRDTCNYIFVCNLATDSVMRYWYANGYYKLVSNDGLKGFIKQHIPTLHHKTRDITEVFNLLITDLNFVQHDDLNNNDNIINFQNGLLYLDTMELKEHTPDVMTTTQRPYNYNPDAKPTDHKYFDNFLNDFTQDKDGTINLSKQKLLKQYMGAIISNVSGWRYKKALFVIGEGNTGKSKLKELAHKLIGSDNVGIASLEQLEARFGTTRIYQKRLSGDGDMSYQSVKELEIFKKSTGGDNLGFEFKGQTPFNGVYDGFLWFATNKLPKFSGDKGKWVYDRMMILESFNVCPPEKQDKQLIDHMYEEKEYIAKVCIDALKESIANNYTFEIPADMHDILSEYVVENDSFLRFMSECTTGRPKNYLDCCTIKRLYDVYKEWCKDNNSGYSESKKNTIERLKELGKNKVKIRDGYRYYADFTLEQVTKKEYMGIYGVDKI